MPKGEGTVPGAARWYHLRWRNVKGFEECSRHPIGCHVQVNGVPSSSRNSPPYIAYSSASQDWFRVLCGQTQHKTTAGRFKLVQVLNLQPHLPPLPGCLYVCSTFSTF
ncbi:hypothetical protein EmuJ_000529600 [Echinococcus multilocularis]|uniref:Uncharacterized protein n=1 Tax=Echinococcus multilocularis TaxID=6211 RepID=A0A068Y6U0_ECHMU|nr:hypothetical protein EmuJ_000529600 [Echinococcus multilocularis]